MKKAAAVPVVVHYGPLFPPGPVACYAQHAVSASPRKAHVSCPACLERLAKFARGA